MCIAHAGTLYEAARRPIHISIPTFRPFRGICRRLNQWCVRPCGQDTHAWSAKVETLRNLKTDARHGYLTRPAASGASWTSENTTGT